MNKRGKAVNGLTPLKAPVPPMLATAIGYTGNARFVSFQRILYGNEVEYFDGRMSDIGNAQAYLVAGAKFERAATTLVESQRVETTIIVSWTHILDRCY
jgi:hypothetical protein